MISYVKISSLNLNVHHRFDNMKISLCLWVGGFGNIFDFILLVKENNFVLVKRFYYINYFLLHISLYRTL